jgi:hypothetical protein
MHRIRKSLVLLLSAAAASLTTGCGSSYSQICADRNDCENGNERDVEACEIDLDRSEEIASLEGCDQQWEELVDCVEASGRCSEHHWNTERCKAESDRYGDCIK